MWLGGKLLCLECDTSCGWKVTGSVESKLFLMHGTSLKDDVISRFDGCRKVERNGSTFLELLLWRRPHFIILRLRYCEVFI